MPRIKGSGNFGAVRSLRLPVALDRWFEQRLNDEPERAASDLLLELVHGGLRLRPGYMLRHEHAIRALERAGDESGIERYFAALHDSFGKTYVTHVRASLDKAASIS